VVALIQMVATARITATALTYQKVAHLLTEQVMADLDLLLRFDAGSTRWPVTNKIHENGASDDLDGAV
jgi:undecaprenyl pyrophosphate synthase